MPRPKMPARLIGPDEWPDSRTEQRSYWLSRPHAERVQAGRELYRKICVWFHRKGPSPASARRTVKPRP